MFLFWIGYLMHFNKVTKPPVSVASHSLQSSWTRAKEYKGYRTPLMFHVPPDLRLYHCALTAAPAPWAARTAPSHYLTNTSLWIPSPHVHSVQHNNHFNKQGLSFKQFQYYMKIRVFLVLNQLLTPLLYIKYSGSSGGDKKGARHKMLPFSYATDYLIRFFLRTQTDCGLQKLSAIFFAITIAVNVCYNFHFV